MLLTAIAGACGSDPTDPGDSGGSVEELVIVTTSLPEAVRAEPYTEAVNATGGGGAYTWSIPEGTLPAGLSLGSNGVISGTPETAATYPFTIRVRSDDGQMAERTFTIVVLEPGAELTITNPAVPPVMVGGEYEVMLGATGAAGATVTWSVVSGSLPAGLSLSSGGVISGNPTTPETAVFTVEATTDGRSATREFTLVVVPNRTGSYDITPYPVVPVPGSLAPYVDEAIARWEAALVGDLGAIRIPAEYFSPDHCGGFGDAVNGTVTDDIIIMINISSIDGPGQTLAQAGPCVSRSSNGLPAIGLLTLDSDDLDMIVSGETLTDLIFHEMGHVLGFGTAWERFDLVSGAGTSDPRFVGSRAVSEYQALGGTGNIPLETGGGEGTAEGHWSESRFDREVMTGFIEPQGVDMPLSRMSIASFADMGYAVNLDAADSFGLGAASLMAGDPAPGTSLGHDVLLDEPDRRLPPIDPGAGGGR